MQDATGKSDFALTRPAGVTLPQCLWLTVESPAYDGTVKVDTCGCMTNPDGAPCNANGCASCKACWGGDVNVPDEDQFCQVYLLS